MASFFVLAGPSERDSPRFAGRKYANNVHTDLISVMFLSGVCNKERSRGTKEFCVFKTPLVLS